MLLPDSSGSQLFRLSPLFADAVKKDPGGVPKYFGFLPQVFSEIIIFP